MNPQLAFEVVIALSIQVTLVVLATIGLQRWTADARAACRLWTICFISILVLIVIGVLIPHRRVTFLPPSLSRQTVLEIITWQYRLMTGLLAIWIIGCAVIVAKCVWQCWHLLGFLAARCETLTESQLADLPLDGAAQDRQLKSLKILVSDEVQGPFCWQLHRPVIVLPHYVIDGDARTRRHILLHELEHLRTRHPMQHFLQGACSTLLWFHPAVWAAARNADLAREFVCDEAVIIGGSTFSEYLRTLIGIAEQCSNSPQKAAPRSTLAFGNRKSALIQRCGRIVTLAAQPPHQNRRRPGTAVTVLLLAVVGASQVWLPTNPLATDRSKWSPWPTWTAHTLHDFGIVVRDFEIFNERTQMHELMTDS